MPLFEFDCLQCNRSFELLVGTAKEGKKAQCPHCRSTKVNKRFSAFGVLSGVKPCGQSGGCSRPCNPHGCEGF